MPLIIGENSSDGNGFAIMGHVKRVLKAAGRGDEWPNIYRKMRGSSYRQLCKITEEVTVGSIKVRTGRTSYEQESRNKK